MGRRSITIGRRTITVTAGGKTVTISRPRGSIENARQRANEEAKRLEREQRDRAAKEFLERKGYHKGSRPTGSVKSVTEIKGLEKGVNARVEADVEAQRRLDERKKGIPLTEETRRRILAKDEEARKIEARIQAESELGEIRVGRTTQEIRERIKEEERVRREKPAKKIRERVAATTMAAGVGAAIPQAAVDVRVSRAKARLEERAEVLSGRVAAGEITRERAEVELQKEVIGEERVLARDVGAFQRELTTRAVIKARAGEFRPPTREEISERPSVTVPAAEFRPEKTTTTALRRIEEAGLTKFQVAEARFKRTTPYKKVIEPLAKDIQALAVRGTKPFERTEKEIREGTGFTLREAAFGKRELPIEKPVREEIAGGIYEVGYKIEKEQVKLGAEVGIGLAVGGAVGLAAKGVAGARILQPGVGRIAVSFARKSDVEVATSVLLTATFTVQTAIEYARAETPFERGRVL